MIALCGRPLWSHTRLCRRSLFFFFSSRRRHTRCSRDWSSDVCSSDLQLRGISDKTLHCRSQRGAPAFVVCKPKRLVTSVVKLRQVRRAAGHKTKLILPQLGVLPRKRGLGVEGIISSEPKQ